MIAGFKDVISDEGRVTLKPGIHTVKIVEVKGVDVPNLTEEQRKEQNIGKANFPFLSFDMKSKNGEFFKVTYYLSDKSEKMAFVNIDHLINKTVDESQVDDLKSKLAALQEKCIIKGKGEDADKFNFDKFAKGIFDLVGGKEFRILLYGVAGSNGKVYSNFKGKPFAERVSVPKEKSKLHYDPNNNDQPKVAADSARSSSPTTSSAEPADEDWGEE